MRDYGCYSQNCPTRLLLDNISDKWATLVLWRISEEPIRFNQLRRRGRGDIDQGAVAGPEAARTRRACRTTGFRNCAGDGRIFDHAARYDAGRKDLGRHGMGAAEHRRGARRAESAMTAERAGGPRAVTAGRGGRPAARPRRAASV